MQKVLLFSRHLPENCPLFNEKSKESQKVWFDKIEGLLEKHGAKMVGAWGVPTEHLTVGVLEVPSLESIQRILMEPEIKARMEFETAELKLAISFEEAKKF